MRCDQRDTPFQPQLCQRRIDRPASTTSAGHADVIEPGESLGCDQPVEDGMPFTGQTAKPGVEQVLNLDLRTEIEP